MTRAMEAWADKDCESVYLPNRKHFWPPWAQGKVVVVKASDWYALRSGSEKKKKKKSS